MQDPKEVVLRVYDVSRGMATAMSHSLLGQSIEGVWHTGVEVYGMEYFFGGGGVTRLVPSVFEADYCIKPAKILPLGRTTRTREELDSFVARNSNRFTTRTYDLIYWNCNHFSNLLVEFLLDGQKVPHEILNQHELIKASPAGNLIINAITSAPELVCLSSACPTASSNVLILSRRLLAVMWALHLANKSPASKSNGHISQLHCLLQTMNLTNPIGGGNTRVDGSRSRAPSVVAPTAVTCHLPLSIGRSEALLESTPLGACLKRLLEPTVSADGPMHTSNGEVRKSRHYPPDTSSIVPDAVGPNSNGGSNLSLVPESDSLDPVKQRTSDSRSCTVASGLSPTDSKTTRLILETLDRLMTNIINNATEASYRIINKSDARLSPIFGNPAAVDCLQQCGFQPLANGETYEFPLPQANTLRQLVADRKLIRTILTREFGDTFAATPRAAPAAVTSPAGMATATNPAAITEYPAQMAQLWNMGFVDVDRCLEALREADGNLNRALDKLIR